MQVDEARADEAPAGVEHDGAARRVDRLGQADHGPTAHGDVEALQALGPDDRAAPDDER